MRIKASPSTATLAIRVNDEVVRVEFTNGEAEVDDFIGKLLCKQFKGVTAVKPPKETEDE